MNSELTLRSEAPLRVFVDAHVFDDLPQGTRTFIREIYSALAGTTLPKLSRRGTVLY
jgi:hypothetical protein